MSKGEHEKKMRESEREEEMTEKIECGDKKMKDDFIIEPSSQLVARGPIPAWKM